MGREICKTCVMDESAGDFLATPDGCTYCDSALAAAKVASSSKGSFQSLVADVKCAARGDYDCIIGVSGGVDSSYVLYMAKKAGLNPLAVHMDNTWNSELAASNIRNLTESLGVDLYTEVMHWPSYKRMMEAFFDADVIDIELLYDNALYGVNYRAARKFNCSYILGGHNHSTEGVALPKSWAWFKYDTKNIKAIVNKRGRGGMTGIQYPFFSLFSLITNKFLRRIKWENPLNLIDFNKQHALKILSEECGYQPYPYKHYESLFTRFYQGYILPEKFGVDKRKNHFSSLIVSGQMERREAINLLNRPTYPDQMELIRDKRMFLKKMRWRQDKLDKYIARHPVSHKRYSNSAAVMIFLIRQKQSLVKFFGGRHVR